ncbi:MAG: AAA family ATPase [Anaerolineales bacterium]|nr:AAA family ATPase [Anaerolineales bacterium]
MLKAKLLGKFEIHIDGAPIEIPSRKAQSLLAYLLMNSKSQHRREKIAGILWPESDEPSARSKLRYSLWQLRSAIGDDYFLADKMSLAFNQDADHWVDCAELEHTPAENLSTEQLKQAAALYQGEFLPGFYEDWIFLSRDQLRASYDNKIALLLQRLSKEERWREVLEWAERWISLGQIPETAFQAMMIAHNHLGDNAGATTTYLRCEQALNDELGVEPSEMTKNIYDLIIRGELPEVSVGYPATSAAKPEHRSKPYPGMDEEKPEFRRSAFVAREVELAWLDSKLDLALAGDGQVAFVVGDAGQGKTAILKQFSQRAQKAHEDLVIAYATCEAFSGIGDPHLPFRNIMALLNGDVAAKQSTRVINQENAQRLWDLIPHSSQALLDYGPDLVESFIPGESLVRRASSYTLDRPDWLERLDREVELRKGRPYPININHGDSERDLFDQYSRVLQKLSQTHLLLLILDDLQWADLGTLSLLFHLARRIEGHRILILGSYRPDDVAQIRDHTQHPLVQMLPEIRRKYGKIEINLDRTDQDERRKFVDDFLNTELNNLDEGFRQALFQHTAGHPLFTIELLRQMQDQGSIIKDVHGHWVESQELSWGTMPAKVEAVIERRINRLPPELREILNAASVEGEEFTAEVIAAVMGLDESEIIHRLSQDLAKVHRLVEVSEIKRVGQQRLSVYRFRHNLFRKYVYENLDIAEQAYLHEKIGAGLEQFYGDKKELVAVKLARHYELSGVVEKAIDFLLLAAKNAKRVSANEQAIGQLRKGLELLNQFPEGKKRAETELALQISLGAPLVATQGYASQQAELTFERARELCEQTGDNQQIAPALWGLCAFYQVRGKHMTAYQMAKQILVLAEGGEDTNLMLLAHWMLGFTHTHLGEISAARDHLETALDLYDSSQDDSLTFLYGQNPRVTCLNYLALNLWMLGYLDQAVDKCQEAVIYAEQISHPYSLTFAHGMAALFHSLRRDSQSALLHSEQTFKLAKESGFPFFLALGMIIRGWARLQSGKAGMALKLMENGINAMQAIGAELGRPYFLSLMAEAYGEKIENKEGLKLIETALDKAESSHELWYESSLNWLWGYLADVQGVSEGEIATRYWQAIEIAKKQKAKTLELRAAVTLVKFDQAGDQAQMARDVMRDTYLWFEEGFDSDLLVEARTLTDKA